MVDGTAVGPRGPLGVTVFAALGAPVLLAGCSPATSSDASFEGGPSRTLRDGTVMLPSFYDATSPPEDVPEDGDLPRDAAPRDAGAPDAERRDGSPSDARAGLDAGLDADGGATMALTNVRWVHALPPGPSGAPPSLDVCVRPSGGGPFEGPVVRVARGGTGAGLSALQATRYLSMPPGRVDVLVVAGTASDCATPLLPLLSGVDLGPAGSHRTVVLSGVPTVGADAEVSPFSFNARVLADLAPGSLSASMTAIRVFNAIPSPRRLEVGIVVGTSGSPSDLIPLFWDVGFGEVGRRPPMGDAGPTEYPNGYYPSAPIPPPGVTVGLRDRCSAAPCGPLTAVPMVSTSGGSLTTAILAVELRGSTPTPVALFCADHAPPIGANAACQVLPRP